MSALADLPNVGQVLLGHLTAIGVDTPQALRELGSKAAFLRIRLERDPGACLHMLYGLQGAIEGVRDPLLAPETKADLRAFYAELEGNKRR